VIIMRIVAAAMFAAALCAASPAAAQSFGVASFFAAVNSQGTTLRGSGIQGSGRTARGRYVIRFSRPITSCAFSATVRGSIGGQAAIAGAGSNDDRIAVLTFSTAGIAANRAFDLIAFCAP
jgi:hypothetical protein